MRSDDLITQEKANWHSETVKREIQVIEAVTPAPSAHVPEPKPAPAPPAEPAEPVAA